MMQEAPIAGDSPQSPGSGTDKGPGQTRRKMPRASFSRLGVPDIPELVALEKLCFTVPWTAMQYAKVLKQEAFKVFGVRVDGALTGYVTFFGADWEMEILNIAVHPARRRLGLGRFMLSRVLHLCRDMGVKRGYLEVRRSNVAAQSLYAAHGFAEVGVRKRYYPDNREDAIVMRLDFDGAPDGK